MFIILPPSRCSHTYSCLATFLGWSPFISIGICAIGSFPNFLICSCCSLEFLTPYLFFFFPRTHTPHLPTALLATKIFFWVRVPHFSTSCPPTWFCAWIVDILLTLSLSPLFPSLWRKPALMCNTATYYVRVSTRYYHMCSINRKSFLNITVIISTSILWYPSLYFESFHFHCMAKKCIFPYICWFFYFNTIFTYYTADNVTITLQNFRTLEVHFNMKLEDSDHPEAVSRCGYFMGTFTKFNASVKQNFPNLFAQGNL